MRRAVKRTNPNDFVQDKTTRNYVLIAAVVIGILALIYILYLNIRGPQPLDGLVMHPGLAIGHDNSQRYEFGGLPPAGGIHNDTWQTCGIYDEPVLPEHAIHSMEHGAIWITYHPDLPENQVNQLQSMVRGQTFILLSPYPDQDAPIALTAWGLQVTVESASDNRIPRFIERYRLGPQTIERGATCNGGVGTPLG
ncbi:MAG: DUF3105 domain-containing protein [Chloroflexota bacterium]